MRGEVRSGERDMRQIAAQWQRAGRRLFDRAFQTQHARRHGINRFVALGAAHLRLVTLVCPPALSPAMAWQAR